MNAVVFMAKRLPSAAIRRLARLGTHRFDRSQAMFAGVEGQRGVDRELDNAQCLAQVTRRWSPDLCAFLNALTRDELMALAQQCRVDIMDGPAWRLRMAMWEVGAALERQGADLPPAVQPRPVALGGHLVIQAPPRGAYPPSDGWPRPVPSPRQTPLPHAEPETLDDLLAAATSLIGVRLGDRGRDKGAWGSRAQALLGVTDRGEGEPDWFGDVEVKTVPIARDRVSGLWFVIEDPAIAMVGEGAIAKLQRTLWLARTDLATTPGATDATIVSWYLLEWDEEIARLTRRYLHERPKGPRGTRARGHYLSKRFFADAGMLASLNGW